MSNQIIRIFGVDLPQDAQIVGTELHEIAMREIYLLLEQGYLKIYNTDSVTRQIMDAN